MTYVMSDSLLLERSGGLLPGSLGDIDVEIHTAEKDVKIL